MRKSILIVVLMTFGLWGCYRKDILIPREALQNTVNSKFPFDRSTTFFSVSMYDPNIYFSDKKLGIALNYWCIIMGKQIDGTLDINGLISYRKGSFYVDTLNIERLTINDHTFLGKDVIKSRIAEIIIDYFKDYPIYTLKQNDFKQAVAKLILKDINIVEDNLKITVEM